MEWKSKIIKSKIQKQKYRVLSVAMSVPTLGSFDLCPSANIVWHSFCKSFLLWCCVQLPHPRNPFLPFSFIFPIALFHPFSCEANIRNVDSPIGRMQGPPWMQMNHQRASNEQVPRCLVPVTADISECTCRYKPCRKNGEHSHVTRYKPACKVTSLCSFYGFMLDCRFSTKICQF